MTPVLAAFSPIDRFAALRLLPPELEENPLDRMTELLERLLSLQESRPPARVSAAPS